MSESVKSSLQLYDLLQNETNESIQSIGSVLKVHLDLSREEKIHDIASMLNDKSVLIHIINRLIEREFLLLKRMIRYNGKIIDDDVDERAVRVLKNCGLLFEKKINDVDYLVLSEEVYLRIKSLKIDSYEDIVDNNNRIYNLIVSMVELYGITNIYDVITYYNRFYRTRDEKVDTLNLDFFFWMKRDNNITVYHEKNRLYFIHKEIRNNKDLWDNIAAVKRKYAPAILEKRTLLKYRNVDFFEWSEELEELKQFLLEKKDEEAVQQFLIDMYHVFRANKTTSHIYDLLVKYDIDISDEEENEFFSLVTAAYKTLRLWINCGYSLNELIHIRESL